MTKCKCDGGYTGESCSEQCQDKCSGHGKCNADLGCVCDCGYSGANCAIEDRAKCGSSSSSGCVADGNHFCWVPNQCGKQCGLVVSDRGSNKCTGKIVKDQCRCLPGWYGPKCGLKCTSACGDHGKCDDGRLGTGKCLCDDCYESDGRGGCKALTVPTCGNIGTPKCNRNPKKKQGNPDMKDSYTCICPPTRTDLKCSTCICKNGRSCNPISHDCDCGDDFIGTLCEFKACTRKEVCNDHGTCEAKDKTSCICDKGWMGKNCDKVSIQHQSER